MYDKDQSLTFQKMGNTQARELCPMSTPKCNQPQKITITKHVLHQDKIK